MTSSFFNFSNVDILQYDSFEQNLSFEGQNFSQAYSKDSNFICTEAPCEDLFNPSSRSKKTSLNPFQSSFQCNFHYEHFETLNKKLQNFMESISSCSEKILKQELEKKILQNQMSSFSSCEEILESENCQIEESEKQKFKVDLKYEKKLREFLDEVCKKLIPEISGEFLAVADFIWVNYTKVMDQRLSESELINWAKNLSETKFKQYRKLLEKTKEICFSEDQSEVFPNFDEAIKGLMEFFFVTVILCVEQYFGNPYFQEDSIEVNSFKRASSESDCYSFDQFSELQQDIYGSKKLKF